MEQRLESKSQIISIMLGLALLLIIFEYVRINGDYTLTDDGCNTTINSPMCCGFNYLPNGSILLASCILGESSGNTHEQKNTVLDVTKNKTEYTWLAYHYVTNSAEHLQRQNDLTVFVFKGRH